MGEKPTYEALEKRVRELEEEARERQRAEEDLKHQKKRLESFIEYSSLAIVTLDEAHNITACNADFESLFHYKESEVIGMNLDRLVSDDQCFDEAVSYTEDILEGNSVHSTGRRRKKGGEYIDVEIIGVPVIIDGRVIGAYAIYIDISDRKKAQEALKKSKDNYLAVFNSANDAIFIHEIGTGKILDVNRKMLEMFGYEKKEEVVGRYPDIICSGEASYTGEDARLWQARADKGEPQLFEWQSRRKNGECFWVEVNLKKAVIGGDERVIAIMRDITERRRAEAAIRESEERLKAIFEANPDPVVVYDRDGLPQYLNPAFSQVFGWRLADLEGKRIPFIPEDQKEVTKAKIEEIYRSGKPVSIQSRRLTKSGDIIDTIVSAAVIKGHDGIPQGLVVNLTDISEQRKLQAQLQQAQRMEAVGTLAGGIAHNFNNFLMGIQGRVSLMMMNKDESHPDHKNLKGIEEYVGNAATLTRQLLGFARGGKYEIRKTEINSLIRSSAEMFGSTRKEIVIHQEYREVPAVEVDRGQIEQMLMNLYVNAWQAMPEGGDLYIQTERIRIDRNHEHSFQVDPGLYVKISITDSGIGMDEETRIRVFEPFFTTKEVGRGTGLGLASVYGIVKNHGGFINVYSEKGIGTTFNIYLPASREERGKETAPLPENGEPAAKILLVDDEEMILEVGEQLLKSMNYSVITAESGKRALEIYEKNREQIDMVILDMIMPVMGGGETFDRLKEINPDIKVLLSSGYSINGQAQEIMERGCSGFIQKPFNLQELSDKIRETLKSG